MIKYLRIRDLLLLTIVLAIEAIFTIILFALLLAYAKHYSEHKGALIAIGVILICFHVDAIAIAYYGLANMKKKKDPNGFVVVDYRRQAYYNAIIIGWLIYPALVSWYAWIKSGYSQKQIKLAARHYIKKHIEIILDSETLTQKMSPDMQLEVKNVEKLIKDNYLTTIEGNEYLYRLFFEQGVITDFIIDEMTVNNIDQIMALEF